MNSSVEFNLRRVTAPIVTLGRIAVSGVRLIVWDTLKNGVIDLRPLSRVERFLTISGLALVCGFLFSILFNDVLRTIWVIEPLTFESNATRGLLVPSIAVPLTLITLTLAWSYVLTGALQVRSARVRWFIFLIYFLFGLLALANGVFGIPPHLALFPIGIQALVYFVILSILIGAFILVPRGTLSLALQFSLTLGLNTSLVTFGLAQAVTAQQLTGFTYPTGYIVTVMVDTARVLIVPFLFLTGVEMVNFGLDVTRWAVRAVQINATDSFAKWILVLFITYRIYGLGAGVARGGIEPAQWNAWAGAALLLIGLGAILFWQSKKNRGEWVPYRLVVILLVLLPLGQILLVPLLLLTALFFFLAATLPGIFGNADLTTLLAQANQALGTLGQASDLYRDYTHLIVALAGIVIALIFSRRNHPTITAFGFVLAWSQGLEWLAEFGHPLEAFRFEYDAVDAALIVALAAMALVWIARRELTNERTWHLLAMALLSTLLTQTSFLDNPFSPLFSFAGVFFLVFGILWNVLTVGGRFTNVSTPNFPRASRLFLYLGYVLLSVCIAQWFIVSHNVVTQKLLSDLTQSGFTTFGLALAYLVFAQGGASLIESQTQIDHPK